MKTILKKIYFKTFVRIIVSIISIGIAVNVAHAQVLFEGYSKVTSSGVHIGYAIAKYEFDLKKKQFIATTFIKTNELGGNLTESLKAISDENFKPISYSYTTLLGTTAKTIDAKFEKNKMVAVITEAEKKNTVIKDLPKDRDVFLSSFLAYYILKKSPKGLSAESNYQYDAIAEEDASIQRGVVIIKPKEDLNGKSVFRVLNEFKGIKFISFVNDKGEILMTKTPLTGINTELVVDPTLATNKISVPTEIIKNLFGSMPVGNIHQLAQEKKK